MNRLFLVVVATMLICTPSFAKEQAEPTNYTFTFTYGSLSAYQKRQLEDFINHTLPGGGDVSKLLNEKTSSIQMVRLAEALLFRDAAGDRKNAFTILRWLPSLQVVDPESNEHGIWKGSLSEPRGRLDQNNREFVGTELIIIRHKHKKILPADIVQLIETTLKYAIQGDVKRDVNPDYANIAIMSAFMQEYLGTLFNMADVKELGVKRARTIVANYRVHNALCEYNTPTYYGVDILGISMWRELAFSNEMREMGVFLGNALWSDVATFYNANLRNMCGPFLRSYGMDMNKYNAVIGVCIGLALDNEAIAPFPGKAGGHYHDASFVASVFELGLSIPGHVMKELRSFGESRYISRNTPNYYEGDTVKKVTAVIYKDWMMGGLWGNRKVSAILKTGTMHWLTPDGDIGWLLIPGEGKTNIVVTDQKMSIYLADEAASQFEILVCVKGLTGKDFTPNSWSMNGMKLRVDTKLSVLSCRKISDSSPHHVTEIKSDFDQMCKIVYAIPASWDKKQPMVELTPVR